MKCPKCENEIPETMKFCTKCGEQIAPGDTPPPIPPPLPETEDEDIEISDKRGKDISIKVPPELKEAGDKLKEAGKIIKETKIPEEVKEAAKKVSEAGSIIGKKALNKLSEWKKKWEK